MRNIGAEIISGIAIIAAVIIFIFGYLYLKNTAFATSRYTISVRFDDVTGLEPSDFVSVAGVRIGQVKDLRLDGLSVVANIEIDEEVKLPKDSQAHIRNLGMVGEKFLEIVPGQSTETLQDGDRLQGQNAGDFSSLTTSMDGLMQQSEEFLVELRTAFNNVLDDTTQENLRGTLANIKNLTTALDRNSVHLEMTLANLNTISTNLNEILSERREKVETTIDNFYEASNKLLSMTNRMETSLGSVQTLLAKIENGEGTLGKMLSNDELYDDIQGLTTELDSLLKDIKKRPQRYINLGFIKVF